MRTVSYRYNTPERGQESNARDAELLLRPNLRGHFRTLLESQQQRDARKRWEREMWNQTTKSSNQTRSRDGAGHGWCLKPCRIKPELKSEICSFPDQGNRARSQGANRSILMSILQQLMQILWACKVESRPRFCVCICRRVTVQQWSSFQMSDLKQVEWT